MLVVITYDVNTETTAGRKRLRQVAKSCEKYGMRVQNSVFECELTDAQLTILEGRLKGIIESSLDSIRIYHLNKNERRRVDVLGKETSYNVKEAIII